MPLILKKICSFGKKEEMNRKRNRIYIWNTQDIQYHTMCDPYVIYDLIWYFGVLMPLSAKSQLYQATSFNSGRSRSIIREPPTIVQATGKLYHLRLRVECTLCCNLQSRVWTHAVLVIGLLYELLANVIGDRLVWVVS